MVTLSVIYLITQANLFEPVNILKFADYLYLEGDYQSALNEYRRYIFLSNSLKGEIHEKIIDCLIKLKRFNEALMECEKIEDTTKVNYTKGFIYFLTGKYDRAREYLVKIENNSKFDAKKLIGLSFAYEFRFLEAEGFISLPKPLPKYKSPILGGVFSLFPGGGHFYCGRLGDGIYSLLVVSTVSALSYYYYKSNEDLKFGISVSATVLFYSASIYGGINAVRNYNYYQNERYLQEILKENP